MKTLSLAAAAALVMLKVSPALAGNNLTITTGTNTNVTAGPIFTTTGDSAILTPGSITSLWSGQNVSIATGTGGANTQVGNITIQQAIETTTAFDLAILAAGGLTVSGTAITSGSPTSTGNAGGIHLEAAGAVELGTASVSASSDGGNGGVILLRSLGAGVAAGWTDASASDFATGNAGSVTI